MAIVIFGANGRTGRILTQRLLDSERETTAVTRNPGDFPIAHPALRVAKADVRVTADLSETIHNGDTVLSTLGVPFTRRPVDTYSAGLENIIAAMKAAGAQRLAVVSSTGPFHQPRQGDSPVALRILQPIIANVLGKTLYDDMRRMEDVVTASGLDWTIVRPSGLFDLPEVTDYLAGQVDPVGAFTARIDLADYLARQVDETTDIRQTVVVSTTEQTPSFLQMVRREAFSS